jgi:predicted deacetylase
MSELQADLAFRFAVRIRMDRELAAWRRLGVKPRLWWRDDDARGSTPQLDRLLRLAGPRPLALAVIPDGDLSALAGRLQTAANVSVGQHGVDHVDRRTSGPPSEYPEWPSAETLKARIAGGRALMTQAGLAPRFYTPPWNAVDPGLAAALRAIGLPILSAGADQVAHDGLDYASAEIDVLSWKRGGVFKGPLRVMSAMRRALVERRREGDLGRPVGLLTHHLVHDEAAWTFLERALAWLDANFEWVRVEDIPAAARANHPRPRCGPAASAPALAYPPAV